MLAFATRFANFAPMGRPKKAEKKFKVSAFSNPGRSKAWRVSGTTYAGKRIRENYASRSEALQRQLDLEAEEEAHAAGNLQAEGRPTLRSTTLTESQLSEAEAAMAALSGKGFSEAVRIFHRIEEIADNKQTSISELLTFCENHFRKKMAPQSVLNAYNRFMMDRKESGVAEKTLAYYRQSVHLLVKQAPNRNLHEVTVEDLEGLLRRYRNPTTKRSIRLALSTFFNWALRRQYCMENPCERLSPIRLDQKSVSILHLNEIKRLLKIATVYKDGACAAAVAIALFAGLRPSELQLLESNDIRENDIIVSKVKMSRKEVRKVPICDVLKAWLAKHPFKGVGSSYRNDFRYLKAATKAADWVQDVLRHTSISYQLERDRDEGIVCYHNGTSKSMLQRHYRRIIVGADDLHAFWSLSPEIVAAVDIDLPPRKQQKRVQWPTDDALLAMLRGKSMVKAAAEIGVSDVAVRKHLKKNSLWDQYKDQRAMAKV